jgi:RNA polymerase sigma-70 factor, ECF subfamily
MINNDYRGTSFRNIALRQIDRLYGYAFLLSRSHAEAEHLVQETYRHAIRAVGWVIPDSNIKAWLFTILRDVWAKDNRRIRHAPGVAGINENTAVRTGVQRHSSADPSVAHLAEARLAGVRRAVEDLPIAYGEAVLLRDFEGFTYQDIAGILRCPVGTVVFRIARARETLRLALL